ncbi:MAG: helix-turn-helix transcriptional regulator [Clostridia bacterium]|nr:helix-turn-helix transcriptional regulator [Clostridia bacterium]
MIKIKLSRLLGDLRISQAELARLTGIRKNTISNYYNEMTDRVNLEHLDRICEALNCDITELLVYEPNVIRKTGENLIVEKHGNRKSTD